jgi:hypothetical protein
VRRIDWSAFAALTRNLAQERLAIAVGAVAQAAMVPPASQDSGRAGTRHSPPTSVRARPG